MVLVSAKKTEVGCGLSKLARQWLSLRGPLVKATEPSKHLSRRRWCCRGSGGKCAIWLHEEKCIHSAEPVPVERNCLSAPNQCAKHLRSWDSHTGISRGLKARMGICKTSYSLSSWPSTMPGLMRVRNISLLQRTKTNTQVSYFSCSSLPLIRQPSQCLGLQQQLPSELL